ncbi:uncharacterized protein PHALS_07300 [Plasmopara halstedii]|uniref:Uncharacterized protein n=1 Tax=Plasmopara halstedii TaxID=4781 RepID=A0A0P1B6X6_PLAHL|nr:uncharacterized protein PHALS_07300 [Plasmopara halstedii]CEG49542.1 hypothetical protein PHALS_07300 [Plasmopara halstedii]|eukprot:XP_024585911.1 hypothetical protein PHALS_07300 [Plasmopara halstedii]
MSSRDGRSVCSSNKALVIPQQMPGKSDAVEVIAQEALAAAALGWKKRAQRLAEINSCLKNRLFEVEKSQRKSMTIVKDVLSLPNNHLSMKQLIDENNTLRRETRALRRQLMQCDEKVQRAGSNGLIKKHCKVQNIMQKTAQRKSAKCTNVDSSSLSPNHIVQHGESDQRTGKTLATSSTLVDPADNPLIQVSKVHLRDLEVSLDRLSKENKILREELDQCQPSKKFDAILPQDVELNGVESYQQLLQVKVDAGFQQIKLLEARYHNLEKKAQAKSAIYHETTFRLEETTKQLFEVQQQLARQKEQLQLYSDQTAQMTDLQDEVHVLRSENLKLNETISTLSSRPFDSLFKDLQMKNLCIAQLEEEKIVVQEERAKIQTDLLSTIQTNDQLRRRIESMTDEVKNVALELSHVKAECERKTLENEVAQLQLRFYTAPGDDEAMYAIGKAIKEMKKQQYIQISDASDGVGCKREILS